MKKIASLIIFAILSGFLSIQTTFACSCLMPESPQKELEKSDLVFQGTVIKIEQKDQQQEFGRRNLIQFDITGTWKGDVDKPIYTQESSAACGYNFQKDQEYVVYAWENSTTNSYDVSLCSRTNTIENASVDVNDLGIFQPPKGEQEEIIDKEINIAFVIIGFILIFGLGFFAFLKSNKKK